MSSIEGFTKELFEIHSDKAKKLNHSECWILSLQSECRVLSLSSTKFNDCKISFSPPSIKPRELVDNLVWLINPR